MLQDWSQGWTAPFAINCTPGPSRRGSPPSPEGATEASSAGGRFRQVRSLGPSGGQKIGSSPGAVWSRPCLGAEPPFRASGSSAWCLITETEPSRFDLGYSAPATPKPLLGSCGRSAPPLKDRPRPPRKCGF